MKPKLRRFANNVMIRSDLLILEIEKKNRKKNRAKKAKYQNLIETIVNVK